MKRWRDGKKGGRKKKGKKSFVRSLDEHPKLGEKRNSDRWVGGCVLW